MTNEGSNTSASTVAAIRGQQQARRRDGSPAAPSLADLRNNRASATSQTPARSRVQQPQASETSDVQTSSTAAGSQGNSRNLRSRLMLLAQPASGNQQADITALAAPGRTAAGFSAQLFSVFTNPLSSAGNDDTNSSKTTQHGRSRAAAALNTADNASEPQIGTHSACATIGAQHIGDPATAPSVLASPAGQQGPAGADTRTDTAKAGPPNGATCSKPGGKETQQQQLAGAQQRTYCFEVQAADTEPEQLIDYNGYDQHSEHMVGPDGKLQQLGGSIQQYVYDEDTGQLCRTGEGAETTRLGRHYLEDCHTGEFFQLAQQPTNGWWAWMRCRPHLGADGWFRSTGDQQQQQEQQQDPGLLHSLSDFLDSMGSVMAALGLFSQGLAGGLALLCLFMTYIQYATAGREGFLAFYSPQAEMINRTFFTLISISLVAAAARHAYDELGNFSPRHLRLGVVDSLVMLLYFLAYTCNLLATPLDDQLAFEARRDPAFYTLPLPAPFEGRLSLWHALNLVRVIACGLAWVLVCYRSNHFVMLRVFEARSTQEAEEGYARQQGAGAGGVSAAGGVGMHGTGPADADRRRLRSMGSSAGSRATAGGIMQQQQQAWAVPSQRFGSCGVGSCPGAGNTVSSNS